MYLLGALANGFDLAWLYHTRSGGRGVGEKSDEYPPALMSFEAQSR